MILYLDNIRSAQNVGSIIRTAEAFGVKKIILGGITPEAENPKVAKTSLGAEKNIKFKSVSEGTDLINKYKKRGYFVVSLEVHKNATNISEYKNRKNILLIIGNEVSGISQDLLLASDQILEIPMRGSKESLNVSVAAGIALYELSKFC